MVRAMREALDQHEPAHVPALDEVEALLGPIAFLGSTAGEDHTRRRSRRRV